MSERDHGGMARPDPRGTANPVSSLSSLRYCTSCGGSTSRDDRYCAQCGHALSAPDTSTTIGEGERETAALRQAHYLLVTGRVAEAIPLLQRLREERPDQPALAAYLGVAYLRVARVHEAQVAIETAIELAPSDFTCRMAYGEYFARLGFYDRAVAQLDRALGLVAPSDEAYRAAFELRRFCQEKTKGLVYRRTALPRMPRLFRRASRHQRGVATTTHTRSDTL